MTKLPRAALIAIAATALVSGVTFARPTWPSELGIDFWELPALQNQLELERLHRIELERQHAQTINRLWRKEVVVAELIDEQIGPHEAGLEFLEISRESPQTIHWLRTLISGHSDEERSLRQVSAFLRSRERDNARITKQLIAKVEQEADRVATR